MPHHWAHCAGRDLSVDWLALRLLLSSWSGLVVGGVVDPVVGFALTVELDEPVRFEEAVGVAEVEGLADSVGVVDAAGVGDVLFDRTNDASTKYGGLCQVRLG
jgi:hypothetical protein